MSLFSARLIANNQIERGDTYPMVDAFTLESFTTYFFGSFACIMVDVSFDRTQFWTQDHPPEFWNNAILGCFYVICHPQHPHHPPDRRSNPTIQEDVPTCATLGIDHFLCILKSMLLTVVQIFSPRRGPRERLWTPSSISVPAFRTEIRLSEFDLQPCFCHKRCEHPVMGETRF